MTYLQEGADVFARYCADLAAAFEEVAQEARREQLAELTAEAEAVFALVRLPFAGEVARGI